MQDPGVRICTHSSQNELRKLWRRLTQEGPFCAQLFQDGARTRHYVREDGIHEEIQSHSGVLRTLTRENVDEPTRLLGRSHRLSHGHFRRNAGVAHDRKRPPRHEATAFTQCIGEGFDYTSRLPAIVLVVSLQYSFQASLVSRTPDEQTKGGLPLSFLVRSVQSSKDFVRQIMI